MHTFKREERLDKTSISKMKQFSCKSGSTVTALHTVNNTVAKGFNQMVLPVRTITVALDMSKAFDTINIHPLIRKLLQTNIPGTVITFIANYIKGYRNHTSSQRQFTTGVPQCGPNNKQQSTTHGNAPKGSDKVFDNPTVSSQATITDWPYNGHRYLGVTSNNLLIIALAIEYKRCHPPTNNIECNNSPSLVSSTQIMQ